MRVRELLTLIGPSAKVLTAPHRLDREIRWVHSTDLPDPAPYLRGAELILTSGLWYHERGDADRFVRALASKGVPALGLALFSGQTVPEGLLDACSEQDVLLILLPDIPFRDITEVVMTRILGERQEAMLHEAPAAKELAARLSQGEGLPALTAVLSREAGAPCFVLLRTGETFGDSAPKKIERQVIWEQAFSVPPPRGGVTEISSLSSGPVTVAPIQFEPVGADQQPTAMLVCRSSLTALRQRIDVLIRLTEHYLPAATERLVEERRQARSAASSMLERLVQGTVTDDDFAAAVWPRTHENDFLCVLVASNEGRVPLTTDTLEGSLRAVLSGAEPLTAELQGNTVALIPHHSLALSEFASAVWQKLSTLLDHSVLLGISGGQVSEVGARQLVLQASNARKVAGSAAGERRWATAREAGSHMLLLAAANPETLESLHLTTLEPLIGYDARHGTQLLETLQTFLAADASWQRAAEILCLHVNSLRYRITRIEQLTGRQMSTMDDRVDFFLALRALDRLGDPSFAQRKVQPPEGELSSLAH